VGKRPANPLETRGRRLLLSALGGATALLALAGCGGSEGVEAGAQVSVYVVPPQCDGARRVLDRAGHRAGELRVRLICVEDAQAGGRLDLARVGANARRAIEDSSAVGYVEARGPAVRHSVPILEEAKIPVVESGSGAVSMARLLDAIRAAGTTGGLREAVGDELE
jgi:hypothetical protein